MAMSDFTGFLDQVGIPKDFSDAVGEAGTIVGTVSGVYGYYQGVVALGQTLGLWGGGTNQFDELYDRINQLQGAIDRALAELGAAFKIEAMKDILQCRVSANGAIADMAQNWDHRSQQSIDGWHTTTRNELALLDPKQSYWSRPWYDQLRYRDAWTGPVDPPLDPGTSPYHAGSIQWDYVLALPSYLHVLACRLTVIMVASPDQLDNEEIQSELNDAADRLKWVYETILSGIQYLPTPNYEDANCSEALLGHYYEGQTYQRNSEFFLSKWGRAIDASGRGYLYGAFDAWSTFSSVETYPSSPPLPPSTPSSPPHPPFPFTRQQPAPSSPASPRLAWDYHGPTGPVQAWQDAFAGWYPEQVSARHAVRSLKHWKRVYSQTGIRTVWQVRNHVLRLLGRPSEPLPVPSDAWSLREVAEAIPSEWRPALSLRATADFLHRPRSLAALSNA
jgi:hypothetical protein